MLENSQDLRRVLFLINRMQPWKFISVLIFILLGLLIWRVADPETLKVIVEGMT